MMRYFWGAALWMIWGISSLMGQVILTGQVLDASTGLPIEGAIVGEWEGTASVYSMQDGSFSLAVSELPLEMGVRLSGYETWSGKVEDENQDLTIRLVHSGFEMDQVIMTGWTDGKRAIDQVGSVSLLGATALNRDLPISPANVLNRVPGVIMQVGALNTNRLTIRGAGARTQYGTNKIRAYFNEIPISTGDGETTVEDVDLSQIGRITVLKGPASSLYGAGLGGTLIMQTRESATNTRRLSQSFTGGSFGLKRWTTNWQSNQDKTRLLVNFNRTGQTGFRENSEYQRTGLTTAVEVDAGASGTLTILASYIDLLAEIPSSLDSTDFMDSPSSAAFTWNKTQGYEDYTKAMMGVGYRHHWNDQWQSQTSLFISGKQGEEVAPFAIRKDGFQTLGGRFKLSWQDTVGYGQMVLAVGGEGFAEQYDWRTYQNVDRVGVQGELTSDNLEQRSYVNAFWQMDWNFAPKLSLAAGLNANVTQFDYQDFYTPDSLDQSAQRTFPVVWSPRIGLLAKPIDGLNIHASLSHGFSPPSLEETLLPDGARNPDLLPETGWNLELGARGRILDGLLSYELSVYRLWLDNLIVAERLTEDTYIGRNAGSTVHTGVEAYADYVVWQSEAIRFSIWGSYTWAHYLFDDYADASKEATYDGNRLPGLPAHHINAGFDFAATWGLYAAGTFQHVGEMPLDDANLKWVNAYQVMNGKLGFRRTFWNHLELDVYGGVQNIMDTHYAAMVLVNAIGFGGADPRYFYPGAPRNAYAGAQVSWKL
ncbi:TonB-dependent receptor domain-containing protein [Pontibacter sp. G13]|uniref:TonB-dependent receptor domain-containing protein n=1 Tax=Pontibacter sp. G13 TaxID=3074898 RepID=UPI00288AC492|nr:TonB-dependent receptor [Pontibacter sp. G13]WNJ18500.1 TonB-dependent receptor [Pontibacter sp. G13]